MKYFQLIENGEKLNYTVAVEDSKVEDFLVENRDHYDIEECAPPADAEVRMTNSIIYKRGYDYVQRMMDGLTGPWQNTRSVVWDGPNCARCKNKYNGKSDFCSKHYRDTASCYRFKLEK